MTIILIALGWSLAFVGWAAFWCVSDQAAQLHLERDWYRSLARTTWTTLKSERAS